MKQRHAADAPAMEWLADISGKTARITAVGSRTLLVENYRGIQKYVPEEICLATRSGSIRIEGGNMSLCEVRRDAIIVRGSIRSVTLPCEGTDYET